MNAFQTLSEPKFKPYFTSITFHLSTALNSRPDCKTTTPSLQLPCEQAHVWRPHAWGRGQTPPAGSLRSRRGLPLCRSRVGLKGELAPRLHFRLKRSKCTRYSHQNSSKPLPFRPAYTYASCKWWWIHSLRVGHKKQPPSKVNFKTTWAYT